MPATFDTAVALRQIGFSRDRSRSLLEALAIEPPAFVVDALCAQVDPEEFYPEKGGTPRPAQRICAACDVKAECLAWALEHNEPYGVWGGTTPRQRRRMLRGAA